MEQVGLGTASTAVEPKEWVEKGKNTALIVTSCHPLTVLLLPSFLAAKKTQVAEMCAWMSQVTGSTRYKHGPNPSTPPVPCRKKY